MLPPMSLPLPETKPRTANFPFVIIQCEMCIGERDTTSLYRGLRDRPLCSYNSNIVEDRGFSRSIYALREQALTWTVHQSFLSPFGISSG